MAKPSFAQVYDDLLTRYGREIADAFLAAVNDLTSQAQVERVIAALRAGNIDEAILALNLDRAAFNGMIGRVDAAYAAGGAASVAALPSRAPDGSTLLVRFDERNPRAEAWLRDRSSALVTRITDEQRGLIRGALVEGMERGDNPRRVALDVVGRLDRATGRRTGGIIGLTPQQERWATTARGELASGDPAALRHYLGRDLRDRRFDRAVAKAIREQKPVPADVARNAVTSYRNRLLKHRGDMIGRTEALTSLNAAQDESLRQLVDTGRVATTQVRRVWRSAGDNRVRHTHATLDGQTRGLDEAFISSSGAVIRYPGDPDAPASERVGCRCITQARVDWAANVR